MIQAHRGFGVGKIAALWFHGNTNRFYDLPYIHVGRELSSRGYSFLTCNTHSHDLPSPDRYGLDRTPRQLSTNSPIDLDPWISYALLRGYSGVVLIGHSFGANKVAYYQAHSQDPRVLGVAFASPDIKWQASPHAVTLAEKMVSSGDGDTLMPQQNGSPSWYRVTAKTLAERAHISHNVFRAEDGDPYLARISCPILAFYGIEEGWCGGEAELRSIKALALSSPHVDTHLLQCADHVYWGKASEVANLLANWMDTITSAHPSLTCANAAYIA